MRFVAAYPQNAIFGSASNCTIQTGKPVLLNFAAALRLDLYLLTGPKFLGGQLLRASAEAMRDVVSVEAQLATLTVHAANHDVSVWVVGVEVIHGRPLEFLAEVVFDSSHEGAHVFGELQLIAVLGRDDEAELILLAKPRRLTFLGDNVPIRSVELSARPILLYAITLEVAQV